MSNQLGILLEQIRKDKKLSLRDVKEKTGLSFSYIRSIELNQSTRSKGPVQPSPDTLRKLSNAYDYPYEELMKAAGFIQSEGDPIQAIINDQNSSEAKKRFARMIQNTPDEKLVALMEFLDSVNLPK
ncbi:helix-turn-helix domain-containing protein [Brevibacillus sp. HD3.3A]|uniref:helix-turn-helix domain-containing protein n=1 Tax=Brevibacillus sp. HD3.3A TaxID=2738979 RepID=UPI00156B17ED|nr:helix-turn-helix transcriptional regulator [Brevibacillus sp. HD3.3A]UED72107.1 helix-turn-helix domain-containing protein [Brevibacillus sp. HD3.3A]